MKLRELTKGLDIVSVSGPAEREITALTSDSRNAAEGGMFVAVRGVTVDGHSFIPSLLSSGLAAIVVEEIPAEVP